MATSPRTISSSTTTSTTAAVDQPVGRLRRRFGQVVVTGAAAALAVGFLPGATGTAQAAPAAVTAPAAASSGIVAPTPATQVAVDHAMAQVGKGYAYGGNGPDAYDCSGLTTQAFAAAGVELPRRSADQATVGTPVDRAALQPGDLVFYYSPVSHVGIYIGNGQMVNALNSDTGVVVSSVDMPGYAGASRVA
ncbi:NlpC/P60 family protein [Klenkia marina]|uniref:NlpC/P60 family protein n=1 Tax=Klenkia marina TaxID=1960309 RepID=A0A1G4YGH7_9ACTN|nr:C40 family peptidase [Klenkia marina]SCX52627.1 NlpC/P60 family protein [Klenkia marina]